MLLSARHNSKFPDIWSRSLFRLQWFFNLRHGLPLCSCKRPARYLDSPSPTVVQHAPSKALPAEEPKEDDSGDHYVAKDSTILGPGTVTHQKGFNAGSTGNGPKANGYDYCLQPTNTRRFPTRAD